ncbi:aspartate/glutamate racemase family protein [Spirosoma radiotolerans]|nr:amino acid racemase [Spirosoma radiotolerans]
MQSKKKLGIIGGMGARAGANFFQKLIDYSPAAKDQDFIEVIMHSNSMIPDRTRAIAYDECSPLNELIRSVKMLNACEVDLIVLTCNTAYFYYRDFIYHSDAPILNPAHLLRQFVEENDFRSIGLLGTTGTMNSRIFCNELEAINRRVVRLSKWEQENIFMRSVYMENGLKSSVISEEAIDLMYQAANLLISRGADLIVGGCSEVSIALQPDLLPLPYIDTMDLMAKTSVRVCYGHQSTTHKPLLYHGLQTN